MCFQIWKDSPQAMESDITLEGFMQAEKVHGLIYTKVIRVIWRFICVRKNSGEHTGVGESCGKGGMCEPRL